MKAAEADSALLSWVRERYPGTYADGKPFDEIGYLQCKLILKPDRFTSKQVFKDFAHLVKRAAEPLGVDYKPTWGRERPQIREVLFLDTGHFHLYNNAFIVRRRIAYEDGFPISDPEIVFKFRHPDPRHAAATDVRPNIAGKYKTKFKVELMPTPDRVGGMRRLMSHNVEFALSQAPEAKRMVMASLSHMSLGDLAEIFPLLNGIQCEDADEIALVNQTIVEELLEDICELDFGHGAKATANLALWRSRGDHHAFVGEFAFQFRIKNREQISPKALATCEHFFILLQHLAEDWLALTTTKTGAVYRLKGNPPQSHE
ncbi:MAG TPA: hypothetical protein VFB13_15255 [Reyranella sp.]|jgi:hypothetical protein|nr:hypothetical protein [Reyranella sp.]